MIYCLHITAAPYSHQANLSALNFARAALEKGHNIFRVFFSGDGVHIANRFSVPPQDDINLREEWASLALHYDVELVVCISACLRRGLVNESEAARYETGGANVGSPFIISGLGQLAEALVESDRLVTFGA